MSDRKWKRVEGSPVSDEYDSFSRVVPKTGFGLSMFIGKSSDGWQAWLETGNGEEGTASGKPLKGTLSSGHRNAKAAKVAALDAAIERIDEGAGRLETLREDLL